MWERGRRSGWKEEGGVVEKRKEERCLKSSRRDGGRGNGI